MSLDKKSQPDEQVTESNPETTNKESTPPKPKKTHGKLAKSLWWVVSPGNPMPGIGTNFKRILFMREKVKEWNNVQKQKIELDKGKSFDDYMKEFEITDKDLPNIRKHYLRLARVYACIVLLFAYIAVYNVNEYPTIGFVAMIATLLMGAQFVVFSLRQLQVKRRELLGLDAWASNPGEWVV